MSQPTFVVGVVRLASHHLIGIGKTKNLGSRLSLRCVKRWAVESLETRAMLSTIPVVNTGDSGPGTLRAAIEQANLDQTGDTITFAPSVAGTINLLTALPNLSAGMSIVGPGPSALTVAGTGEFGPRSFRIFTVSAGARVAISGLTITGGNASGSGAADNSGGGIENLGTLSITNDVISGNSAGTLLGKLGTGGGIDNSGTLSITDASISGNTAKDGFSGFFVPGTGGGINNSGTLTITDASISGNTADSGAVNGLILPASGGGINNTGILSITDVAISGSNGGGIYNGSSGMLTVNDSTIDDNAAADGGGIGNSGKATITCSTFSGNTASGNGGIFGPFPGAGGGIGNSGTLSVVYSTFSGNSASAGGGIDNSDKAFIVDTIVAGNTTIGSSAASDIDGKVTGSYNLIGRGGSGGLRNGRHGNIVLKNLTGLGLSPLGANGGPTQTMALLKGSRAIHAGIAVSGVTTDQRGITRPSSHPDIGAFELSSSTTKRIPRL